MRYLTKEQRQLLLPIETVRLHPNQVLYKPGDESDYLYFVESGLVMSRLPMDDGYGVPIWPFASGGRAYIGTHGPIRPFSEMLLEYRVEVAGKAWRISRQTMRDAMEKDRRLEAYMIQIMRILNACLAQTLACRTVHSLPQRIASQLLILRYTMGDDRLPLTRIQFADMIPTSREYMAAALTRWGKNEVTFRKDEIEIRDAEMLERRACGCFRAMMRARNARFGAAKITAT